MPSKKKPARRVVSPSPERKPEPAPKPTPKPKPKPMINGVNAHAAETITNLHLSTIEKRLASIEQRMALLLDAVGGKLHDRLDERL